MKFHLSPLRERPLDVAPLAMEFVQSAARKCGVTVRGVHPQFLAALRAYHWPGNLRELNNCMERAVVLCRNGLLIPSCLPPAVLQVERPAFRTSAVEEAAATLPCQVSASERTIIEEALRRHGYRRSPAAQELGVSRVTLYNKMKKHGLLERGRRAANADVE
jgi:transcriptional regulator with PAS, ATPase and Fis domain